MKHNLFHAKNFEDGRHQVVGDCNGISMDERYRLETPLFAHKIIQFVKVGCQGYPKAGVGLGEYHILDYGCGVGRLAKEILERTGPEVKVYGVDASPEMRELATKNCNSPRFIALSPEQVTDDLPNMDLAYCVYVLQHVPAIELRGIIERIHLALKSEAPFIYCSSDYRMAIRFDGQGFCDDRFLGVDIRAEIGRLFTETRELFDEEDIRDNQVLAKMVKGEGGGLPHPAKVYQAKSVTRPYCQVFADCEEPVKAVEMSGISPAVPPVNDNLVLVNRLAPGDCLVMTAALRDLHLAHPGHYKTDVRTPCSEIFENNPYVTKFPYDENEYQKTLAELHKLAGVGEIQKHTAVMSDGTRVIDMQYPLIHRSGATGAHFSEGHREWLEEVLKIKIPRTNIRPELYLSQTEKDWVSPVVAKAGYSGQYWVINAGSKSDFTLKQYPYDWYQEVVTTLKNRITFVQVGAAGHNHKPLDGAIDMVGQTNLRELFRTIYHADGVLTCVSLAMHVAGALNKPAVVVSGGREGVRWEAYPFHQYLYANGAVTCAMANNGDGCWRNSYESCKNKKENIPLCFWLMTPADVIRAIDRYYIGGRILEAVLI